jgi:hypothetical protein
VSGVVFACETARSRRIEVRRLTLHLLEWGACHHLVLDRPEALARAVRGLLDDLDAGKAEAGASARLAAS